MKSAPIVVVALVSAAVVFGQPAETEKSVRFNRDIRPILANHCYQCHGPDSLARKGGLRLDLRDQAIAAAESGDAAIVPGRPDASRLLQRISSDDPSIVMPPPEVEKPLSQQQKELLRRWIEQGAEFEAHWSYTAPVRPELPTVKRTDWPRNEIDFFVLERLEREELEPSSPAELTTLIRRLSLDLTGLPPTIADTESFAGEMTEAIASDHAASPAMPSQDTTSQADVVWLRWVNRYLESPHYGERMAVDWLDAARYADTNGYQVDRDRQMYLWRDWVIDAFNSNKPFDQFTLEQIAGDLLPDATQSQKIATGFHRNHMLNEEGGIIPDEFLAEYCADRVETTASVWLGQTLNCSRCHDHKFDPFTQRDFYSLYAFFHNLSESGIGNYGADIRVNAPPFLKVPTPEQDALLAMLREQEAETKKSIAAIDAQLLTEQKEPEVQPRKMLEEKLAALTSQREETDKQIPTVLVMEELPQPRETRLLVRGVYNNHGDVVTANTPASLPAMSVELPRNRLGLAKWLVDPNNPLPARVTANRLWQSLFGVGLVRTSEDFGTQGEVPSHPELLDWLADEFVRSHWDVKHMLRLMVSSATYRQSSRSSANLQERDPENRLLARGPRFRLQAEFLRDQALSASGLLVTRIGGPSVKSYHPPGLYEQVTSGSGTNVYVEGTGDDLHRRSMYSYWKRSVPNPAMLVFDAPFREACSLRRTRTNTPLQALNLMNDPTYVEAARFLAGRMLTESSPDLESQISHGFRLLLSRTPKAAEVAVLAASYDRSFADFKADPAAATELLMVGARRSPENPDPVQLAAMTMVASTLLNLDEAVMKE